MEFSQVFGQAKQFYDQLSPQQRQAVAQQFRQHFGGSSDPQLQQQAQNLNPSDPDPQQLGQVHDYAQQADPNGLNQAMDHPDVRDALTQQGVSGWGTGGNQGGYQNHGGDAYQDQGRPGGDEDQGGSYREQDRD